MVMMVMVTWQRWCKHLQWKTFPKPHLEWPPPVSSALTVWSSQLSLSQNNQIFPGNIKGKWAAPAYPQSATPATFASMRWDTWADQKNRKESWIVKILKLYANYWILPKLDIWALTIRLANKILEGYEPGSRSCFLRCPWTQGPPPHCATGTCCQSLRLESSRSEKFETLVWSEWKMAASKRAVTQCSTDCCCSLSYQPLSRIWCVISPPLLIMPLIHFNYFPFKFSRNVQRSNIFENFPFVSGLQH